MHPPEPPPDEISVRRVQKVHTRAGILAGVVTAVALLLHFQLRYGLDTPPSPTGDEPSYDSLAWELSRGNGFAEDFDDPAFRRPYERAAGGGPDTVALPELAAGTVTYRPPLFPAGIAVLNRLFGRQFFATRLLNIACMAVTAGLLVWFLLRQGTVPGALLAWLLFLLADVRVRLYGRAILTEALAVLLTTLLALCLIRLLERRTVRDAVAAGVVMALMVLNRTSAALWIPPIAVSLLITSRTRKIVPLAVCWVAAAVVVYSPWAVRNIRVLEAPMPLGTQGMMELSAGFCDAAWDQGGVWVNLDHQDFFDAPHVEETRIERERSRARRSRTAAVNWIRSHPGRAVVLGLLKIGNEYRPRHPADYLILTLALIGAASSIGTTFTRVGLILHAASALSIAATWSVEGRFVVPLLFTIHVWAGLGISWLWQKLRTNNRTSSLTTSGRNAVQSDVYAAFETNPENV